MAKRWKSTGIKDAIKFARGVKKVNKRNTVNVKTASRGGIRL